jgi:cytochrome c oxidase cbb3-type subunit 1
MSLRTFDEITHLTEFHVANIFQQTYGFFAMVAFGSIYYIVPRLLRKEWPSSFLINVHFWTVAVGIVMQVLALSIGGWIQGWQLTHPAEFPEFIPISLNLTPYLVARSVSTVFLLVGHLAFATSFVWMLVKKRAATENARELFRPAPALRLETAS